MAKDKKVEQITDMEQDFAQWFTDVCTKAELVDYSGVKGLYRYFPSRSSKRTATCVAIPSSVFSTR